MRIGYGRVSTRDQHPEAQHDALTAAGCDEVFIDRASGKLAARPELDKALLSANRAGDQLVITKLDLLGRSLEHLIELSSQLQALAWVWLCWIKASTPRPLWAECSSRAWARLPSLSTRSGPSERWTDWQLLDDGGKRKYTVAQLADEFGVTRPTIYRHLAKQTV
jgi:DNA invertase Pin-like site-specific DNA recombinase